MNNPGFDRTDQGSQLVRPAFTGRKAPGIQIGMDGRGRALDQLLVERVRRSPKYGGVSLKGRQSVTAGIKSLGQYLQFCNEERAHRWLVLAERETPVRRPAPALSGHRTRRREHHRG